MTLPPTDPHVHITTLDGHFGIMHSAKLKVSANKWFYLNVIIIITITIIFLHGLGRLTCSGIDALPSFPGASTISSSSRFVVEGVFRESGVVHSFKLVDPVLFVIEYHVLYSLVYPVTLLRKRISAASRRVMSLFVVTHVSLP